MEQVKVTRKEVGHIAAASFPHYKGRKFRIVPSEKVTLADLNWSGGTRSQYRTVSLSGQSLGGADAYNAMAPWANPAEGKSLPVPAGVVVVEHTIFCGKDIGLTIWTNPYDMPRLLKGI